MEATLFPFVIPAQPRDLQFSGLVLEMFFDVEAVSALRPRRADRQTSSPARQGWGIDSPTIVRAPRRRRHTFTSKTCISYSVEKHFQDGPVELQIPRLRSG